MCFAPHERLSETVCVSVSLKTKLNIMDLHRLVGDVRRRVEHEITFEGTERRIKSVLLSFLYLNLYT